MSAPVLTHTLRVAFDRTGHIDAATLSTYLDETVMYTVALGVGPFDTVSDLVNWVWDTLDKQLELW